MARGGRSSRGSGRGSGGGTGRGSGGGAGGSGRGPGAGSGRRGGGAGGARPGGGSGGKTRGTILQGGPLDGQKAQVPLEDGWFDLFPQPDDPSAALDPDEVGHRYVAEGHRWVYGGTVTAATSEKERRERDEPDPPDAGE